MLMVVVVAVTAPVLGGGAAPPVLVPYGVTLAGIPVGGMSFEQAQAAVRPAFARPLRIVFGDRTWRVRTARFGVTVAVAGGVSRALDAHAGDAVALRPRIDGAAARAYVSALAKRYA